MNAAQPRQDLLLGVGVHRRQRIVQDQDARVRASRRGRCAVRCFWPPDSVMPRSPTTCRSPSGTPSTSLSSRATRRGLAQPSRDRSPAPASRSSRGLRHAERHVLGDRVREQERLLRHEADRAAQAVERDLADVDAVDEHRPRRRVVQARQQVDQRRLARAGRADERDGLPGLDARARRGRAPADRCPDR